MSTEIAKAYSPAAAEARWYALWEQNGVFRSVPDEQKKPFTIVIPPPNITGSLTMGHILNNSIQDIYIRLRRMQGYNACWVPGTDHASIATETKVVKFLKEQGIDKYQIGRDAYLEHCQNWKTEYGGLITQQLRKLGVSCDWSRERFTMDDEYYAKVIAAFVRLYQEGKIYRGYRIVNWCPVSKSAISDEEVIPREVNGKLWHIKYPLKASNEYIVVATTRPETMLGDTGVAVNPDDERYKAYIGKSVVLPITGREIPIFADAYVDKEFGTGAVKVTPAHDKNDYAMGQRHGLAMINIMNEDASLNHNVPDEFRGLDRYVAREKLIRRLQEEGYLLKVEEYHNTVGYSERGGVPIEPYLSEQWFMRMDELAAPALEAVRNGKVTFYPGHWIKTYEHWMGNIQDWCISRQLWWGHRIPVWYHLTDGSLYCSTTPPVDPENWRQDDDVLDTWASSWLWAHDVFRSEEEKKYYVPTDLLVTGPDIIFFWVARMIMATIHFEGKTPFREVYFTSIIRDEQGRKMSKSLGNSPDPLKVIADYGADALRFTIIYLAPLGQDVLFSEQKCEFGRNFANKIWNAGRFLLMNKGEADVTTATLLEDDLIDRWITSRYHSTVQEVTRALDKYEINTATKVLYAFFWNDFCDWYIELIKNKLYADDERVKQSALKKALAIFDGALRLMHPFMPFLTEELWQLLEPRNGFIATAAYPVCSEETIRPAVEKEFAVVQEAITSIRTLRAEMNIAPSKKVAVSIRTAAFGNEFSEYIEKLVKAEPLTIRIDVQKPEKAVAAVTADCEIYLSLDGVIDVAAEREKILKEMERLAGAIAGIQKKLSNESFVKNAPQEIVEKERAKLLNWQQQTDKLTDILKNL